MKQHFPDSTTREGEKQRRKRKSDVLAPLHSLLVALIRFRKQSAGLVTVVWLIGIYAIVFGITYVVRYFQTRSLLA
jgi:uncharacterized membrane protein HdeD (DUF308 family)